MFLNQSDRLARMVDAAIAQINYRHPGCVPFEIINISDPNKGFRHTGNEPSHKWIKKIRVQFHDVSNNNRNHLPSHNYYAYCTSTYQGVVDSRQVKNAFYICCTEYANGDYLCLWHTSWDMYESHYFLKKVSINKASLATINDYMSIILADCPRVHFSKMRREYLEEQQKLLRNKSRLEREHHNRRKLNNLGNERIGSKAIALLKCMIEDDNIRTDYKFVAQDIIDAIHGHVPPELVVKARSAVTEHLTQNWVDDLDASGKYVPPEHD